MSPLFILLWLISIPAFIVGLVNPKWVLISSRKGSAAVYGGIFIVSFIGIVATTPTPQNSPDSQKAQLSPSPKISAQPSPSAPKNPPSPQIPQVGQKVKIDEWELVVEKTQKIGKGLQYTDFGNIQQASGTWLVIEIAIKNIGQQPRQVAPFNFKIVDSSGVEYEHYTNPVVASMYATTKGRNFLSNPIVPGGDVKSSLIFDVSPSSSGFKLKFSPGFWGKEQLVNLGK